MAKVFHLVGGQGTNRTTTATALARYFWQPSMQIVLHEDGNTYLFDGACGWFDHGTPLPDRQATDAVAAADFMFWVRDERADFCARPGDTVLHAHYITKATAHPQTAAEA